jgi:glycosyltransferase involved in cell wall biosynthesis
MKILMLTPYLPYPLVSGGQIRTFNLLKHLKDKHDITLFALIKEEEDRKYVRYIEPFCHQVKVFKRSSKPFTFRNILKAGFSVHPFVVTRNLVFETIKAVDHELSSADYDLIHAETFYMMPNIPKTKIPTILVEQTIEYLGYLSYAQSSRMWPLKPFLYLDIAKIKYWEQYYWQHSDHVITMSEDDLHFIRQEKPNVDNISVVANGVDIDFFNEVKKNLPQDPTVLFVGTFSWLPNVQAVNYLVKKVWPLIIKQLPKAKLHIVGFKPTREIISYSQDSSITVSGSVQDIRTAYSTAHALVAPVKWGKGTRYKILEAMATKTPIITTPLAVEGIKGIKDGDHVMLANTPDKIAQSTVKVLTDTLLRQTLAKNSYTLVKNTYNWPAIAAKLDEVYESLGTKSP